MKMKSVLVSMLALAAVFSSCSKDGETPGQGGPGAITGDTYLSVALGGSRSARTYAANTAAGTVAESTVKSGYILTFNAQRQKLAATPLDLTKDIVLDPANQTLPGQPSGNTGNISAGEAIKVSDATKYVMIVLNPTPALEKTLKTATSFAELKDKALSDIADVVAAKDGFPMINQGVFDGTNADEGLIECSGNLFTKDNMGSSSTPQEAAKAKPVSVVVVRLVAKVGLSTPMQEVSTISSPNAIVLEDEAENAAIFLDGWLTNTTNKSYLPYSPLVYDAQNNPGKDLSIAYRQDNNYPLSPATDFDWLKNATPPSAWNTKSDPVYVVENTMSVAGQKVINTTKLVLKARFFPEDFKDTSDASKSETWFVFSSDSVGTHTELISYKDMANLLKGTASGSISADDVKMIQNLMGEIAKKASYVKTGTQEGDYDALYSDLSASATPKNPLDKIGYVAATVRDMSDLADYPGAYMQIYYKGICYYDILIKHNSNIKDKLVEGKWGVVRNNWYTLKIDKISKRGTPFIPDPTDPDIVDPSNPDENTPNEGTDAYLSVTVTVADWTTWERRGALTLFGSIRLFDMCI